jgi:AAA+ superfamily predicted ATPase
MIGSFWQRCGPGTTSSSSRRLAEYRETGERPWRLGSQFYVAFFGGVGKTLLARATAGECGLPFFNVRIEEILVPYFGVSERNLHGAFEAARATGQCVLFLDELDAIAYTRRRQHGSAGRGSSTSCSRSSTPLAPTTATCSCSPRRTRRGASTKP